MLRATRELREISVFVEKDNLNIFFTLTKKRAV